jgi:hypothetical protein
MHRRTKLPHREVKIEIAAIIISVISDGCDWAFMEGDACERFIATNGRPEVVLCAHYGDIPKCNLVKKIFDSGSTWSLHRAGRKRILRLGSLAAGSLPSKIAVLEPDFRSGDIYIRAHEPASFLNPLIYPLNEILMVNLLSLGRGGMFHACGIKDNGQGILFVGASGAGKSTLANLWKKEKDVTILSDDRIIIRRKDGKFWAYGTPWHGDAKVCSPERAPLEKIFFLQHAKVSKVERIEGIDAASKLLVCSFPTFWDKKGMEFTLGFIDELTREVPCYELGFVPNKTVIDFVKDI